MYLMAAIPKYGDSSKRGSRHGSGSGDGECRASGGNGSGGGGTCGASMDFGLLEIDENDNSFPWGLIHHNELAHMLNNGLGKTMVIDSRSFLEYNTSNVQQSVNVCCSKLVKRRLQQDKVHVLDLLTQTCNIGADASWDVIVYDQCTEDPSQLTSDNFVQVLLHKLSTTFNSVAFLKGGFLAFQASHPSLTENKSSSHRCSTLTSLSQPCMPVSNVGPTRILPFLYLGSQQDALNQEMAQVNGITYVLNVSKTCPRPPWILEGHFHRIPVNDNYCEKLLPFFQEAFQFLDKVREANGCVLVHCLGGVSRSATLAIAYIMRYMRMSSDEAYRYVKDKRPTISPNFNFLGQLLEYEKIIRKEEQDEEARKEAVRALMIEEGVTGDLERASPGVMDLHTTSPSSPGPRTAHRSFMVDASATFQSLMSSSASVSSSLTLSISQECPFPGPLNTVSFPVTRQSAPLTKAATSAVDGNPPTVRQFSFSSDSFASETCSLPEPPSEMCPLPGPSYQNRLYSRTACFNATDNNHTTDATLTTTPLGFGPWTRRRGRAHLCDNSSGQTVLPLAQSPVCPITGFPSPAGPHEEGQESTCPRTGFPGPELYGSSHSSAVPHNPGADHDLTAHCLGQQTLTKTEKRTETLFQDSSAYHNHSNSSKDVPEGPTKDHKSLASQSNSSDLVSDLSNKRAHKEQHKTRQGFSFSSVFSSFRWKSRPPTLPLGSPVGSVKESGRYIKKHGEDTGSSLDRVQLTPVSEAIENCDLIASEDAPDNVNESVFVSQEGKEEKMETSECVSNIKDSGSSLSNATSLTMASTHMSVSSASHTSSSQPPSVPPSSSLKLRAKNFTLALSSPTNEFPVLYASSSLTLASPGDSNKRKSGFPSFESDSPDKLAKTEESHHALTPPRTLNLSQGPVGKLKQKLFTKKFVLPLSSPTAAMARLNVASPSEPPSDSSLLAAKGTDDYLRRKSSTSPRLESEKNKDIGREAKTEDYLPLSMSGEDTRHRKVESTLSLIRKKSSSVSSTTVEETLHTVSHSKTISEQNQRTDTSMFSSVMASSSSSSLASKPSMSASSSTMSSSTFSEMSSSVMTSSSSSSSSSVNIQGFSNFPTTSLDKLSFTPCYTKDIVQELKLREAVRLASGGHNTPPSESNPGVSALDSPMSISSGSSAPSIASSTLSPLESSMANPFTEGTLLCNSDVTADSSSVFALSQPDGTILQNPRTTLGTPDSILSPSPTSEFILSPSSLPQATVAPSLPPFPSPYYCSSSSVEPLSPMSISDSSSNSPIRSPTRNGIYSPPLYSLSSPASSLPSPLVTSSSFSSLVTSPTSSSSHISSPASYTTPQSTTKVVRRRDRNKRVLDRPNSIAFSSYPACDLVTNATDSSGCLTGSQASQDDASEVYMSVSNKRARPSVNTESHVRHGRTSWGRYSEREVYQQITAAMESAMQQTQAYTPSPSRNRLAPAQVSSRKARSLDDILDSSIEGEDFLSGHRRSRHRSRYTDQQLFEKYHCGMHSGSEPYHSSSSLSSNGSHGSSLEIIQLPR